MESASDRSGLHPDAISGIDLFDQGEFYEAHEPLEKAWMETAEPERLLYQGILQIGLAYFQISRDNYRGALKMFRRGRKNLTPLGESMLGVNIQQLLEDAQRVEDAIRQLGPDQLAQLDLQLIKKIPWQ
jgi:predicted metal-dependent hydrolase